MKGFEFYPGSYRGAFGWNTNDNLALIGVGFAAEKLTAVTNDIEGSYLRTINEDAPELAERMRNGKREERFVGGAVPNYFRKPYGPGWALVGDAGYQKDPCTAEGISDAFRSADLVAQAIDDGMSDRKTLLEALAAYEEQRNQAALPLYEFTCMLATLAPPPADMMQLLNALQRNQEQTNRFFGLFAQTVSVPEFFSHDNMQRIFGDTAQQAQTSAP